MNDLRNIEENCKRKYLRIRGFSVRAEIIGVRDKDLVYDIKMPRIKERLRESRRIFFIGRPSFLCHEMSMFYFFNLF